MDFLKDIFTGIKTVLQDYASIIGILFMSLYGGLVAYTKSQKVQGLPVSVAGMFLDGAASVFIGLVVGMAVLSLVDNTMLACAMSGYAGHEGTRKIFLLINQKIKKTL